VRDDEAHPSPAPDGAGLRGRPRHPAPWGLASIEASAVPGFLWSGGLRPPDPPCRPRHARQLAYRPSRAVG